MRVLKFVGLLLVNLVVAVIGTAILDTGMSRVIPSHSIAINRRGGTVKCGTAKTCKLY
jgi:hypothetical protein